MKNMNKQKIFIIIVAATGVVSVFLPWLSVTEELSSMSMTIGGIDMWQGAFSLLGFVMAIGVCFSGNQGDPLKGALKERVTGAGAIACLFALLQLVNLLFATTSGISTNPGFGLFLSLLSGVAVVVLSFKGKPKYVVVLARQTTKRS